MGMSSIYYKTNFVKDEKLNPKETFSNIVFYENFDHRAQYIVGQIFYDGIAIQWFLVDESNNFKLKKLDDCKDLFVESGRFIESENYLNLTWNTNPVKEHYVVCDYEYEDEGE